MTELAAPPQARVLGRYALYGELAAGGMATVHFGRLLGPVGFSRTVAIKRLHPQFAKDPEFVSMFLDEARLAARIQHPNVVATLDVVALEGELFLVMEYVSGESLSKLIRAARQQNTRIPPRVVTSIMSGMLHGLHAAHEAKSERGEALDIVHRDVSPQNILVGTDGVSRVLDFGVAKAALRAQSTRDGQMKGKMSYMAPEQLEARDTDRRTDLFAVAVVLWEALTGKRLFDGNDAGEIFGKVLKMEIPPPSAIVPTLPRTLDKVVLKGLSRAADERFASARDFAIALEKAAPLATPREVGEWVESVGGDSLSKRAAQVAEIESVSSVSMPGVEAIVQSGVDASPSIPSSPVAAPAPTARVEPELASSPSVVSQISQVSQPTMASQVSNVTLSTPPQVPPRRRGVAIAVGVGAGTFIAMAVGAAFLVLRTDHAAPPVVAAQPGADVAPAPAASAPSVDPSLPAVEADSIEVEEIDGAALERQVGAAPRPVASAPPVSRAPIDVPPNPFGPEPAKPPAGVAKAEPVRKEPPAAAAEKAKPKGDCNPPFTVDAQGVRRLKPHCL